MAYLMKIVKTARNERIALMYEYGFTLTMIGERFDMSRQCVHQILRRAGVEAKNGGAARRRESAKSVKVSKSWIRETRCQRAYGCSWDEFVASNGSTKVMGTMAQAYMMQKRNAHKRRIEWRITLPEWVGLWNESGLLHLRKQGGAVMARHRDLGPYAVGNVTIMTSAQNIADYHAWKKEAANPSGGMAGIAQNIR